MILSMDFSSKVLIVQKVQTKVLVNSFRKLVIILQEIMSVESQIQEIIKDLMLFLSKKIMIKKVFR